MGNSEGQDLSAEVFGVRLRQLSEYGSVAYLVEKTHMGNTGRTVLGHRPKKALLKRRALHLRFGYILRVYPKCLSSAPRIEHHCEIVSEIPPHRAALEFWVSQCGEEIGCDTPPPRNVECQLEVRYPRARAVSQQYVRVIPHADNENGNTAF